MIHWLLVGRDNTDIVEADDFDDLQRLADSELYHTVVKLNDESIRKIKEALAVGTVRHAKWIPKITKIGGIDWPSGMKCSGCGEDALNAEGTDFLTDFCPHCGARMDSE